MINEMFYNRRIASLLAGCVFGLSTVLTFETAAADSTGELGELSIEQLMGIEVTSVAKKPQKLSQSAAAIHVISREDIRRSGATNLPEVLKLAPGIDVARINANEWVVGSRGAAGRFSTGLLVLIDGRSVYSPFFAGVFWETLDVVMQDIERIEVIRGPGGSIWGANAVNGVINIITRHSADTQEGVAFVTAGNEDAVSATVRYGGELAKRRFGRVFAKVQQRGASLGTGKDPWDMAHIGFRIDDHPSAQHTFRVSGEIYTANFSQVSELPTFNSNVITSIVETVNHQGAHLLGDWRYAGDDDSILNVQAYWDYYERKEALLNQRVHTFDVSLDQRHSLGMEGSLVWGAGLRYSRVGLNSSGNTLRVLSDPINPLVLGGFVQGEWPVARNTLLTLGTKLEHNSYTGFELQPSLRLHWRTDSGQQLWASVSRAVRTPTVLENDVESATGFRPATPPAVPFGTVFSIRGNSQFESEQLVAVELGYRALLTDDLSVDAVIFNHNFKNSRSTTFLPVVFTAPAGPFIQPFDLVNNSSARMQGLELGSLFQASEQWRFKLAYTFLNLITDDAFIADGPQHTLSLRSEYDFGNGVELDIGYRRRSQVLGLQLGATRDVYASFDTLDVRLGWKVNKRLELTLVGQNLLDPSRVEQIDEVYAPATEVGRSVFVKAEWRF